MQEEIWKDVVGFEEYFKVSNLGSVWSKRTNKLLKQTMNKQGYLTVTTKIGGHSGTDFCLRVHRLVAEAFLESPDEGLISQAQNWVYGKIPVNHKDGNKCNNCVENLEWVSYSQNIKHAVDNGFLKVVKGSDNKLCKLPKETVEYIRQNYKPYDRLFGSRALARKFGVFHSTILDIINNVTYT